MNKTIKIIVWSCGGALALALVAFGSGYLWSYRLTEPVIFPSEATLTPDGGAPLGTDVTAQVEFTLPMHAEVRKAAAVAGEGSTVVGEPSIKFVTWHWSTKIMRATVTLRAYRPGAIGAGSLALELRGVEQAGGPEAQAVVLPEFDAEPLPIEGDSELLLAGAVEPVHRLSRLWLWWLLVIPVGLAVWYAWSRAAKREKELSPWERALAALRELRGGIEHQQIPVETGFTRLTDLVRNYLELRFALPASRRTTEEFLQELDAPATPLPPEQRPFLREFLRSADQVKFAKAPADTMLLTQALDRAEQLVESTRVKPEETTVTGKGGEVK